MTSSKAFKRRWRNFSLVFLFLLLLLSIGFILERSLHFFCHIKRSANKHNRFVAVSDPFVQYLRLRVLETIEQTNWIPSLQSKELNALTFEIADYWSQLVQDGMISLTGSDAKIRPIFAGLQGIIEYVLATELHHTIESLVGVIHTPMPATPLCSNGALSEELVAPSIASDPFRFFSVKMRSAVIRKYLEQGGSLYMVYPKEGLNKRTLEQRGIYERELAAHSTKLFDCPLECASIDDELIGAFYLFTDRSDQVFAFAIMMDQASNPREVKNFRLWFGRIDHPAIADRISTVHQFISNYTSLPISLPHEF